MKKFLVLVVVILAIWAIVASLGGDSAKTTGDANGEVKSEVIKVGFVGPLTGDTSALGNPSRIATEIAVSEINATGGINGKNIELIAEDGQCNPKAATNAVSKLINVDKVTAIIGGLCSSETAAFAPSAMAAKVPVITYCSSAPNLTGTGKYFFRTYPSDAFQGKFAAEYAYNVLKARKVAVLYHLTDWGTGLRNEFTKKFTELGGKIVFDESTPQDARDYRTQLAKVKQSAPDYLYAPTYAEGGKALLGQIKDLKINVKILGADAWVDSDLQKATASTLDVTFTQAKSSVNEAFTAKMKEKTTQDASICAPQAYDATVVLGNALKSAGTDPDMLADAIRATKIEGVSGPIEYDQNGDILSANYQVMKIKNGKGEEVK